MKVKFDAYVLCPLAQKFQNWIVDQSTARDFTVDGVRQQSSQKLVLSGTMFWSNVSFMIVFKM